MPETGPYIISRIDTKKIRQTVRVSEEEKKDYQKNGEKRNKKNKNKKTVGNFGISMFLPELAFPRQFGY